MEGDGEHARVAVEGGLGAVAVVHVPVDDRDALHAVHGEAVVDGDRDVAEDAEAAAHRRLGVVAGRAHERVAVVELAGDHRVGADEHAAGRQQRDLVAAVADGRELAGVAAVAVTHRLHRVDVVGGVEAQQLVARGVAWLDHGQLLDVAARVEQVLEPSLGLGVLEVQPRLQRVPERHEAGVVAGVVPRVQLVVDEACLGHGDGVPLVDVVRPTGPRAARCSRRPTPPRGPCSALPGTKGRTLVSAPLSAPGESEGKLLVAGEITSDARR